MSTAVTLGSDLATARARCIALDTGAGRSSRPRPQPFRRRCAPREESLDSARTTRRSPTPSSRGYAVTSGRQRRAWPRCRSPARRAPWSRAPRTGRRAGTPASTTTPRRPIEAMSVLGLPTRRLPDLGPPPGHALGVVAPVLEESCARFLGLLGEQTDATPLPTSLPTSTRASTAPPTTPSTSTAEQSAERRPHHV